MIVDCWHNRILSSIDISLPISQWNIVKDQISSPHSIAYDKDAKILITEDTGRNSILVFALTVLDYHAQSENHMDTTNIEFIQNISFPRSICSGPHRSIYSIEFQSFFVLCSASKYLTILELKVNDNNNITPIVPTNNISSSSYSSTKTSRYHIYIYKLHVLSSISDLYTRSFTIHNSLFYFVTDGM